MLIAALPQDMRLDIVGASGPDLPRVRWLGPRNDIPELLAAADLLVVPSRWEGFGIVAAEGMAAGVPIVASAVDGLVEVVGDAGVLVPPSDVQSLRAAIESLRDDPARREFLGARGRARVRERFHVRDMVAKYEALYRELADSPKTA